MLEKLKELDHSKATGLDNIPARFLKDAAVIITPHVTHIVNLSIELGCFRSELKLARAISLYKKGIKLDHGNYQHV